MIKSLRLENFKNFADETLHLGPFTLIAGANASGKSNIRDAFRFLNGVGRGYTLAEIFGGKYGADWQPIRGAPGEIVRHKQRAFSLEVEMQISRPEGPDLDSFSYSIQLDRGDEGGDGFRVVAESLTRIPEPLGSSDSRVLFSSESLPGSETGTQAGDSKLRLRVPLIDELPQIDELVKVTADKPGLSQGLTTLDEHSLEEVLKTASREWLTEEIYRFVINTEMLRVEVKLGLMRFLEFSPERLRAPSTPDESALGDTGDHLPAVLKAICASPQRKAVLLSWLHELTPMDVSDLEFPVDLNGRVNLRIVEASGQQISAYSASDGTLRFLGMLAALLNEDFEGIYFIEEIDNGIHPSRLHLLLELIERQTAKGKIQVVATTHSPDVLNLINDTTFENAVVVYRDEDAADAVIRRVAELPNAGELRQSQGLGRLHASGWMEHILAFSEIDDEDVRGGE